MGLVQIGQRMLFRCPGTDKEGLNHLFGHLFDMNWIPCWVLIFVDSQCAYALYSFAALTHSAEVIGLEAVTSHRPLHTQIIG